MQETHAAKGGGKTFIIEGLKVKVLDAQSYLTLCNPMDCSPPGPSVHGIFQARILPTPGDLLDPGTEATFLVSPALAGQFFTYHCTTCETLSPMGLLLLWDLA